MYFLLFWLLHALFVCVFFSSFTSFLWNKMLLQASDSIDNVETFMLGFRFFFSFSFVVIKIGYIRFNKCGFSENGIWFWDFHSVKKTIYSSNRNNVKISTVLQWNNFLLHRRYHTVWYQFAIFKYHQTVIQLYSFYYVTLLE